MQYFLDQIADYILEHHIQNTHQLQVVFPNRRAGLFLQKRISEKQRQTLWSPRILSMEQFLEQFSDLKRVDNLQLSFKLFSVYQEVISKNETFDQFYPWSDILLNDFNSIDRQCIDAEKLFANLRDLKALEDNDYFSEEQKKVLKQFWKVFENDSASAHKKVFLEFWESLPKLYAQLRGQLLQEGLAYPGMIARQVAEERAILEKLGSAQVLFCGFNALSKSEERVIKHLINGNKAKVFWDVDAHMLSEEQESGLFMRKWRKDEVFKNTFPDVIPALLKGKSEQDISLTELPLQHAQAAEACRLLNKNLPDSLPYNNKLTRTAMVLPDETQLFPLLHQLPAKLEDSVVNVTMGVSLRTTPVFSLLESLLSLQQSRSGSEKVYFYHKAVISILRHPYVRSINPQKISSLIFEIESRNQVYIHSERLQFDELSALIFQGSGEGLALGDYLLQIIDYINLQFRGREEARGQVLLEEEYLGRTRIQIERLVETANAYEADLSSELLAQLIRQMLQQLKIPFIGEPLQGLQVMGVLETRCLDFDEVYILSLNDGVLPAASEEPSLIPYFLRVAHGLPTIDEQDAVYAYNFYRLLMHSKKIHLFYSSYQSDDKEAEPSRFIQQIQHELWPGLKARQVDLSAQPSEAKTIVIQKELLETQIAQYFSNGESNRTISPSAINTYLNCQLQFALKYLLDIKEPEKVAEEVDGAFFGNVMHDVLHKFYESSVGYEVTSQHIEYLLQQQPLKERILEVYQEKSGEVPSLRRNSVYLDIIEKMIHQVLEVDKAYAPFNIIGLEQSFSQEFPVMTSSGRQRITIKGQIDRIDEKDGNLRVVDYKTGKDERSFSNWQELFDRNYNKRNKAVMQVLLYSLLYAKNQNGKLTGKQLQPTLYNSKELFQEGFEGLLIKDKNTMKDFSSESQEAFSIEMTKILEELFDSEQTFAQREGEDGCKYCSYKEVCGR